MLVRNVAVAPICSSVCAVNSNSLMWHSNWIETGSSS